MKIKVIIDMPEKCEICPFSYYTEGCYTDMCNFNGRPFEEVENEYGYKQDEGYLDKRPEWCPLNKYIENNIKMTLKETIQHLGISQRAAAEIIGMPLRTLEAWIGGKRTPPEWVERLVIEKLLSSDKKQ